MGLHEMRDIAFILTGFVVDLSQHEAVIDMNV
jgi:hypothetical protein